jgi:hypothetical protein
METDASYLRRKKEELDVIAACLSQPQDAPPLRSLEEVIAQKFRLAAAVKAERALDDWAATETSWDGPRWRRAGPFAWRYEYQRADLVVRAPAIYRALAGGTGRVVDTIYSACGMSALATLLLSLRRTAPGASLLVPQGAYNETLQLVANDAPDIAVERAAAVPVAKPEDSGRRRVLLVDSSVGGSLLPRDPVAASGRLDLVIFDTTCLSPASGRIRRILGWADDSGVPLVLVRSHAKLDLLGVEYGRLGSSVFVAPLRAPTSRLLEQLAHETRDAIRLLGAAPVPAHFPPFAGGARYETLSVQRTAALIRNGRRMIRRLRAAGVRVTRYQHGLYALLHPAQSWELDRAKQIAARLAADLRGDALPVRHAGSFGFDFCALDGFPDPGGERYVVRLAFPDIPADVAEHVADCIGAWWEAHVISGTSPKQRAA